MPGHLRTKQQLTHRLTGLSGGLTLSLPTIYSILISEYSCCRVLLVSDNIQTPECHLLQLESCSESDQWRPEHGREMGSPPQLLIERCRTSCSLNRVYRDATHRISDYDTPNDGSHSFIIIILRLVVLPGCRGRRDARRGANQRHRSRQKLADKMHVVFHVRANNSRASHELLDSISRSLMGL